jgi:hypothetical protein
MMFPILSIDPVVRVYDKTRLDASRSFSSVDGEIVSYSLLVDGNTIDVTTDKYLDWAFKYPGQYSIKLTVTDATSPTPLTEETFATITVVIKEEDPTFSEDSDLVAYEPDILKWIREGRSSYLDIHRAAVQRILSELDEKRVQDSSGEPLSYSALMRPKEFKDWSKFMVLRMIFEGVSNAVGDVFDQKAQKYKKLEEIAAQRSSITVDIDGDGKDDGQYDLRTFDMVVR